MHDKVKGFLAAQFHDAKKLLLNRSSDRAKKEDWEYASWGPSPNHAFLDCVEDQGEASDLGRWKEDVKSRHPLSSEVIALIKLLQGEKPRRKLKDGQSWPAPDEIKQFPRRLLLSLRAADAIHKALYQGDERTARHDEESGGDEQEDKKSPKDDNPDPDNLTGQVHVARQYPFYYPFYGNPVVWMPERDKPPPRIPRSLTKGYSRDLFKELLDKIAQDGLQARNLVKLQQGLGDFPESTYLPVTSIGFHQRFVATLFLLLYEELTQIPSDAAQKPHKITLFLNTIISPPERLTNRLRDTAAVRKISHRLQHQLHGYFKEHYLKDMDELAIRHPNENPFFFYNKDAIVLMNRAADQEEIKKICQEIAKKTESVITLDRVPIEVENPLKEKHARAYLGERSQQALWVPLSPPIPQFQVVEEGIPFFCASCNKPTQQDLHTDIRDDPLCDTCRKLRDGYCYCEHEQCQVYITPEDKECPYCKRKADTLPKGYPSTVSRKFISGILRATFFWERCVCSCPTMKFG